MAASDLLTADGSINVRFVEGKLQMHYEAIREIRGKLLRAGATPMLLKELDATLSMLARAIGETKQLYD